MNKVYPIPWIKGYGVTKDGRVWSYPKERSSVNGKFLRPWENTSGYLHVHCGQHKNITIHRLLAKMFLQPVDGKNCVNHKNGVKTDNRIENLEWCTHSENNQHAQDTGLSKARYSERQKEAAKRTSRSRAFLTGSFLCLLARFHDLGLSYAKLAKSLPCSAAGIHKAIQREGLI